MGIRVNQWSQKVADFWEMESDERSITQEEVLRENKPVNAIGERVVSLSELEASPALTKKRLREQRNQHSDFNGGKKFKRRTSGTTGEPIDITLSTEELSIMLGVRDYCFRHYSVCVGDREARFWGRVDCGWKSKLKNFLLNRKVCFPSGEGAVESVVRTLKWRPDYLYGYASLLLEAAEIIEKNKLHFNPPKCVVCTAETILPAQKKYLENVFGAPVAEEYGASEFDIIAFECKSGHLHFVNPWHVILEKADSFWVSDVSRKTTSLINYDLGDSGAIEESHCSILGSNIYLKSLSGRSLNQFVYVDSGVKFHVVELSYAVNEFQNIENIIFRFLIFQSRYGVLDFYLIEEIAVGVGSLKEFMENYIHKKTGKKIHINVVVDQKKFLRPEKSYFIQKLNVN